MVKVLGYKPRPPCDDNLYAITASCAFESMTISPAESDEYHQYKALSICRPSQGRARPARVISNLRFMMFISSAKCRLLVENLLLDELNTLDVFRRTVFEV